jgi:hypothetical protein
VRRVGETSEILLSHAYGIPRILSAKAEAKSFGKAGAPDGRYHLFGRRSARRGPDRRNLTVPVARYSRETLLIENHGNAAIRGNVANPQYWSHVLRLIEGEWTLV